MNNRSSNRIFLSILVLLILALVAVALWSGSASPPLPEALAALESDSQITVSETPWLHFAPNLDPRLSGLIFYPGGRVDPRAYAPLARRIAQEGYPVWIVPMPLNLAVLDSDAAAGVIAAYPQIESWVIAGHSLGGSMAAHFTAQHPDEIAGLALWAAYPGPADDLSALHVPTALIYGTRDGLVSLDDLRAAQGRLPANSLWLPIEGGNHAQFGSYGPQRGDQTAVIDRLDQQTLIVEATLALLAEIERNNP